MPSMSGATTMGTTPPTIDGDNIDGWIANFDNGVWHACGGVSNNSREKAATLAVVRDPAVVAAMSLTPPSSPVQTKKMLRHP
jgi:hypothetical protein